MKEILTPLENSLFEKNVHIKKDKLVKFNSLKKLPKRKTSKIIDELLFIMYYGNC